MRNNFEHIKLSNLSRGVSDELFEREFKKVLENIADINTSLIPRTITLKVTIKPNENRESGEMTIKTSSTIAPVKEHKDPIYFSISDGEYFAFQAKKFEESEIFNKNVSKFEGMRNVK